MFVSSPRETLSLRTARKIKTATWLSFNRANDTVSTDPTLAIA